MNTFNEAKAKVTMTDFERRWHRAIKKLLMNDGNGHKHAAYAEFFDHFALNIVPAKDDPNFTASTSFDEGLVRINSGFLTPDLFPQLSIIIRHELAHNLMMHQIRMMKNFRDKYGEDINENRISYSLTFKDLMNVLEDMEIHSQRMTSEERELIRNMTLNGRKIGGLIAEDSPLSSGWATLTVEQMYDELSNLVESLQNNLNIDWDSTDEHKANPYFVDDKGKFKVDQIAANINKSLFYNELKTPTNFFGTIPEFISGNALYHFTPLDGQISTGIALLLISSLPKAWQDIIKDINNYFESNTITKQQCRDMMTSIAKSSITSTINLNEIGTNKVICTLYTPEEKLVAVDTLKAILPTLEEYNTWYAKVKRVLSDDKYSKDDLEKVLSSL